MLSSVGIEIGEKPTDKVVRIRGYPVVRKSKLNRIKRYARLFLE